MCLLLVRALRCVFLPCNIYIAVVIHCSFVASQQALVFLVLRLFVVVASKALYVIAKFDYKKKENDELTICKGDQIRVRLSALLLRECFYLVPLKKLGEKDEWSVTHDSCVCGGGLCGMHE